MVKKKITKKTKKKVAKKIMKKKVARRVLEKDYWLLQARLSHELKADLERFGEEKGLTGLATIARSILTEATKKAG